MVGGKRPGTLVLPQLSSDELNHFFGSVGPRVAAEVADRDRGAAQPTYRLPRVGACGFKVSPIDIDTLTCTVFVQRAEFARPWRGWCVSTGAEGRFPRCRLRYPSHQHLLNARPGRGGGDFALPLCFSQISSK